MADEKKEEVKTQHADKIFQDFKEHSVADFFKKNKQMLGLSGKIKTMTTIVHEFVTNSIDACEAAGILPDLEVKINELGSEHYEIIIQDNGPGIPKKNVGQALGKLLAGTKFHKLIQARGQQGIGASGAIMFAQMSTGKPSVVESGTNKEHYTVEVGIDTKNNEPKLGEMKDLTTAFKGTKIRCQFKDIVYRKGESSPMEYLRRTAIANPHCSIKCRDPLGETFEFHRASKDIPPLPIEVQPHPRGATIDELLSMAKYSQSRKTAGFLKNDFDRMGDKAIDEIQKMVEFDLNKDPKKLSWEEAEQIIKAFKKINFIAPRTDILRPIGEERLEKSLKKIVEPEYFAVITRKPAVYQGYPFQVEVAVLYGGKAGRDNEGTETGKAIEIMRFANLAPLLFESGGCAITKAANAVEWKRYGIKDPETAPLTVLVNLVSVHIPYTGAGKTAITDEEEVFEELKLALMDAGRKISHFLTGKRVAAEKEQKRKTFLKYATEVAIALSELTGEKKEMLEKKLHELVLKRLKLEEEMSDDELRELKATEKAAQKEAWNEDDDKEEE